MTEAEWLACEDPAPMLLWLGARLSTRKCVALLLACCRTYPEPELVELTPALLAAERHIEGKLNPTEINYWAEEMKRIKAKCVEDQDFWRAALARTVQFIFEKPTAGLRGFLHCDNQYTWPKHQDESNRICCRLLREVLNPFASTPVEFSWLTSTVIALAKGINADNAFELMPILADALQDAGCDNNDILSHCRGEGPHVRGCWVVDLVLGK